MTTIAYRDGIIAADSRVTQRDFVFTDNAKKIVKQDGRVFALSGSDPLIQQFRGQWPSGKVSTQDSSDSYVGGFVEDENGVLFHVGVEPSTGEIWSCEHPLDVPASAGHGMYHCNMAMHLGLSAAEAVKATIKLDPFSGGRVRTYRLRSKS